MKIKLYFGQEDAIKKSGIGRAFVHQKKALELSGIPYTTDKDDLDYESIIKRLYIMLIAQKKILKILLCFLILFQGFIKNG